MVAPRPCSSGLAAPKLSEGSGYVDPHWASHIGVSRAPDHRHAGSAHPLGRRTPAAGLPEPGQRADAARRRGDRRPLGGSPEAWSVLRRSDRLAPDLRRPGRDRDRERKTVQRNEGGARAADGHGSDPQGHQQLADRYPARAGRRDRHCGEGLRGDGCPHHAR